MALVAYSILFGKNEGRALPCGLQLCKERIDSNAFGDHVMQHSSTRHPKQCQSEREREREREREEQVRFRFGFILGRSIIAAEEEADSQQQGADASHVQASHWLDEHLDKLLLLLLLFRFDARYVDRE